MLSHFTYILSRTISACVIVLSMSVNASERSTQHAEQKLLEQAQSAQHNGRLEDAFKMYQALAEQGVSVAQFALAFAYEQGLGVTQSQPLACEYYLSAATQSVPLALEKTGDCYLNHHLSTDTIDADENARTTLAQSYYEQANQNGIFSAACKSAELTLLHQSKEFHANAIAMCKTAVNKGSSQAALLLGYWYLQGKLVPLDLSQAAHYLMQAKPESSSQAALGLAKVYDQLALLHPDDIAVLKHAIYWHELLASKGQASSYLPCSLLYWRLFDKTENQADLAKAYLWANAEKHVGENVSPETMQYIATVNKIVPNHWKAKLDTQIHQQLTRFHTL